MTQRLPIPGSDNGTWGSILNGFLEVSHNADGTLSNSAVVTAGAVTTINTKTPTNGSVTLAASDVGALTQSTADGRYAPTGSYVTRNSGTISNVAPLFFINPKDYGAKCDGTTDDTAAWQAAAAAIPSNGGVLIHPGGLSIMSGTLTLKSGTILQGPGPLAGTGFRFPSVFASNMIQSASWGTASLDNRIVIRDLNIGAPTLGATDPGMFETRVAGNISASATIVTAFTTSGAPSSGYLWVGYQFVTYTGTNTVSTTITGSVSAGSTTVPLTSTTGLANSGGIMINGFMVTYTGISGGSLTGISSGSGIGAIPSGGLSSGATAIQYQFTGCSGLTAIAYAWSYITQTGSQGHGIALQCSQFVLENIYVGNSTGSGIIIDGPGSVEGRIRGCHATTFARWCLEILPGATDGMVTDFVAGPGLIGDVLVRGQDWAFSQTHLIGPTPAINSSPFNKMRWAMVIAAAQCRVLGMCMDTIPATQFLIDSTINGASFTDVTIDGVTMFGGSTAGAGVGSFLVERTTSVTAVGRVMVNGASLNTSNFFAGFLPYPASRLVTTTNLATATNVQLTGVGDFSDCGGSVNIGASLVNYTGISIFQAFTANACNVGDTSLQLNTVTGLASSGAIAISGGYATYTGISGTTLTGIPATGSGSIATARSAGFAVTQNYLTGCQGGSSTESATTFAFFSYVGGESICVTGSWFSSFFYTLEIFINATGAARTFAGCIYNNAAMEGYGTATLASVSTVTISHGLGGTPNTVQLTPTASTQGFTWEVTSITASQFTITLSGTPTGSVTFSWYAKIFG